VPQLELKGLICSSTALQDLARGTSSEEDFSSALEPVSHLYTTANSIKVNNH
jgi:hypothetical protein